MEDMVCGQLINILSGNHVDHGIPFAVEAFHVRIFFKLHRRQSREILFREVHGKMKSSGKAVADPDVFDKIIECRMLFLYRFCRFSRSFRLAG